VRPPEPERVVRVKVLADPSLRGRNPRWHDEVRGLVEAASDHFEKEFGIRFVTAKVSAWPETAKISSTRLLLNRLMEEVPLHDGDDDYDVVIAFTAEPVNIYVGGRARVDRVGDCRQGLGNYVVSAVFTRFDYQGRLAEPSLDVIALVHELGHIFGARHNREPGSIMHEDFDYRSEFDKTSREVILGNKFCPFGGARQPSQGLLPSPEVGEKGASR
jgi:hypothetical protein